MDQDEYIQNAKAYYWLYATLLTSLLVFSVTRIHETIQSPSICILALIMSAAVFK